MSATFVSIFNVDGTCTNWYCGKQGVVLAVDSFSPEFAHWFCAGCWQDFTADGIELMDIIEDKRPKEPITEGEVTVYD